jgi:hypothetical protein
MSDKSRQIIRIVVALALMTTGTIMWVANVWTPWSAVIGFIGVCLFPVFAFKRK